MVLVRSVARTTGVDDLPCLSNDVSVLIAHSESTILIFDELGDMDKAPFTLLHQLDLVFLEPIYRGKPAIANGNRDNWKC